MLVAALIRLTVVVGLVLRLQPRDGQVGSIGRAVDGARKPIGHPRWSLVELIDHSGGGTAHALLVPVHIVAPNVATAAGAGDGDLLSRRSRHRAGLSQHKLSPRPCKEGGTQISEDRTDPFLRWRERSSSQVTNGVPSQISLQAPPVQ